MSGMNIANNALNKAKTMTPATNSMMKRQQHQAEDQPEHESKEVEAEEGTGKKSRKNIPLLTGSCLHEFRGLELVGRAARGGRRQVDHRQCGSAARRGS